MDVSGVLAGCIFEGWLPGSTFPGVLNDKTAVRKSVRIELDAEDEKYSAMCYRCFSY